MYNLSLLPEIRDHLGILFSVYMRQYVFSSFVYNVFSLSNERSYCMYDVCLQSGLARYEEVVLNVIE